MGLSSLYNRIALISPYCEIALRHLYWKNVKWLGKFNPNKPAKSSASGETKHVDFEKVIDWLKAKGVGEGSLLIVHSSYGALQCTGLDAEEIINRLLKLVGSTGTLAMPAIRKYRGEPSPEKALKTGYEGVVCTYNVKKTVVSSGILPATMVKRSDSVVSHHPLNPLVAIGPLAKSMMEHNLDGDYPSSHGPNSCWKFCYDNNAIVIGLGVDLDHYNTMCHINEEAFGNWKYSDEEWYCHRCFKIIDEEGEEILKEVSMRKLKWGMLHFAEINANKDRNEAGLIDRTKIDGQIAICIEEARRLVDHLQEDNKRKKYYYI